MKLELGLAPWQRFRLKESSLELLADLELVPCSWGTCCSRDIVCPVPFSQENGTKTEPENGTNTYISPLLFPFDLCFATKNYKNKIIKQTKFFNVFHLIYVLH